MTFIFRNRTIFWNILKWNRGQKNETEGVQYYIYMYQNLKAGNLYLNVIFAVRIIFIQRKVTIKF